MSVESGSFSLPESIVKPFMAESNSLEHLVIEPVKTRTRTLYNPVEYYGDLTFEAGAPYNFRIDESKFGQYLIEEFGFNSTDFEKLRVHVIGEAPPKRSHNFTQKEKEFFFDSDIYKPRRSWAAIREDKDGTQHIIFYAFNFWRALNVEKAAIIRFAKTKHRTEKSWKRLDAQTELLEKNKKHPKLGRRFTQYISRVGSNPDQIPVERAVEFISRFVSNYMVKNSLKDHAAIHETSHSFQYKDLWKRIVKRFGNDNDLVQKVLESMAEADELRLSKKKEWAGLIDFQIAQPDKIVKLRKPPAAIKLKKIKKAA